MAAYNRNVDEAGEAERLGSVSLIFFDILQVMLLIGLEKTHGLVCHSTCGL